MIRCVCACVRVCVPMFTRANTRYALSCPQIIDFEPQDIGLVDPQLFKTLCKLQEALRLYTETHQTPVQIDGCDIADLGLAMTVPGYDTIELCPGGTDGVCLCLCLCSCGRVGIYIYGCITY